MTQIAFKLNDAVPAAEGRWRPLEDRSERPVGSAEIIPFALPERTTAAQTPRKRETASWPGLQARIYRSERGATQSGRACERRWVLEFEPQAPLTIEPLMGWTSSRDPLRDVRLTFPTRESAVRFAERQGYAYSVTEPAPRRFVPNSYAAMLRRQADPALAARQNGSMAASGDRAAASGVAG